MAMIVIAGWIDVEPEHRDDILAESLPFQRSTREDEPGCNAYVFAADPLDPARIHVFEQWDSSEALEAHFQHPNFAAMGEMLRRYPRRGSQTLKHRVDAVAPVRNTDGVATATFPVSDSGRSE
jgi:quinol monooxygenase YgiN